MLITVIIPEIITLFINTFKIESFGKYKTFALIDITNLYGAVKSIQATDCTKRTGELKESSISSSTNLFTIQITPPQHKLQKINNTV